MKVSPHREIIASLCRQGYSSGRIAERLKICRRTVERVVKQFRTVGHVQEKPRSGRPRTVNTSRIRKIIKRRIDRNDGLSLNKVASDLKIGRYSVQRIVKKELGLRSYRLLQGQTLSDAAKDNRLAKAKKMLTHFRTARIENVLFTDEKVFAVEVARNSQNHRQLLSPTDRSAGKRRFATKTLFPKSVMCWAGITASGKTPLIFIEKGVKINSTVYQEEILKKVVVPWTSQNFPNGGMIFQQDWAPAHGSKSTLALCDRLFPGYLTKELWPSNSPDLNPMDFSVWSVLESKVSSKSHNSLDSLKKALTKAWDEIDTDYLRATVGSFQKRLKACVKAKGSHFEQFLD